MADHRVKTRPRGPTTVGDRLAAARAAARLTQAALAETLGLTAASVSGWERDEVLPSPAHLVQLADLLAVSIDWLLRGRDDGRVVTDPSAVLLHFSDRLKVARRDRGFATSSAAARSAGMEQGRYEAIEAARAEPEIDELVAIAGTFDVSLDFLVLGVMPRPGDVEAEARPATLHETAPSARRPRAAKAGWRPPAKGP